MLRPIACIWRWAKRYYRLIMSSTLSRSTRPTCNDASCGLPRAHTWHRDFHRCRSTARSAPRLLPRGLVVTLCKPHDSPCSQSRGSSGLGRRVLTWGLRLVGYRHVQGRADNNMNRRFILMIPLETCKVVHGKRNSTRDEVPFSLALN